MASSQIKSENMPPPVQFPFAWNSPAIPGTETVVTTLRSDALIAIPEEKDKEPTSDLMRRLFPSGQDTDDSYGIRLGHFTIQRRIGIGGMGSVFLATDEQLRRNVALKVLSPSLTGDPGAVLRFQNEARAAARLDHDNIARIFFYGEDGGLHYIAYEYIPGSNLRDVIRSKDRLAPAEAVNYTMQLAAALSHTAAAGVIHRDIKPSNVLITPQGRAKLVDLGLARKESTDASAELTVAGTTLGTFDYISPEQAKDPRSVDVRSDIYSLGCTLYHMLTGEPPYPEGTVLQKLLDHQGKEPPDPMRKNRRVPPALSAIVQKMMASEPRKRYSSPAKLLSDLLKVARLLGTGAVPIDGQVWLTATRADQQVWQGNIGWIATAAALLFLVIAMERFPSLSRRLDPRATGSSATAGNTNASPGSRLAVPPDVPMQATTSSPLNTTVSSGTSPDMSNSVAGTPRAATSSTGVSPAISTQIPRVDQGPPQKIFDDLPILSRLPGGDTEFVSTPSPEKSRAPSVPDMRPDSGSPTDVAGTARSTPVVSAPGNGVGETRPVIAIVGGKAYDSLEAACSEAKDGTIIELRYNGSRGQYETPIRLTNKENVIIRSGVGYRPIVEFAPVEPPADAESRMITVTGGSLQLINVDVILTVPERVNANRWAVFSLEQPRELQLRDVTVTLVNPGNQPACVIEHKAAPGPGVSNMEIMKNGTAVEAPRVYISDSLLRGECDLILLKDPVAGRFQLKDAVVAIQGALLHANCQAEISKSETDRVTLDLDSTTCLVSDGLILAEGSNQLMDHTPPMTVTARDNIFWCDPGHPLIAMMDAVDLMEMERRFKWSGDRNHYDAVNIFWQLGGLQGATPAKQLDFDGWRNFWRSGEGAASVNLPVKWRLKSSKRIWSKMNYSAVEFDSNPLADPISGVPGASLSKLPPPPADRAPTLPDADAS